MKKVRNFLYFQVEIIFKRFYNIFSIPIDINLTTKSLDWF